LRKEGFDDFLVIEREDHAGGLSSSYMTEKGFVFDFGGHVTFSAYPEFNDMLKDVLKGQYLTHLRSAWIHMRDRLIPYPLQNNVHLLPPDEAYRAVTGAVEAYRAAAVQGPAPSNFREWLIATFGEGIAESFLLPYNSKNWAHPLEAMDYGWIAERVSVVNPSHLIKNMIAGKQDSDWGPNNYFRFPVHGGTGEIFRRQAETLGDGKILYGKEVAAIDCDEREVRICDGTRIPYDVLLTTAPIPETLRRITGIPDEMKALGDAFLFSSVITFGLGFKGRCPASRHWIYFPEESYPFFRVTYFFNYSPFVVPSDDYFSMLAEVSFSPHRPCDEAAVEKEVADGLFRSGLVSPYGPGDLVEMWRRSERWSYPVPFKGRDALLGRVIPFLEERGVYSRGRFGSWKYEEGNMDHSFMQGKEIADSVLQNRLGGRRG
jgi:protoporphyrinogen oxidase